MVFIMLCTPLINKALDLSYKAHEHHLDRSGSPYIFHLYYIASQMEHENEICTALLKDILEDRTMNLTELAALGFSKCILEAITLLTRPKIMSFETYLRRVSKNELAKKVLIQDLSYDLVLQQVTAGMNETSQKKIMQKQNALSFLQSAC